MISVAKIAFASICILITASQSFAQEGISWLDDVDQARAIAARDGKLVLVHFWNERCGPCVRLETSVFPKRHVGDAVHAQYVPVKVNTDENPSLTRALRIDRVPQDVLLTPDGSVITQQISPNADHLYVNFVNSVATQYRQYQQRLYDQDVSLAQANQANPNQRNPNPLSQPPLASSFAQGAPRTIHSDRDSVPVVNAGDLVARRDESRSLAQGQSFQLSDQVGPTERGQRLSDQGYAANAWQSPASPESRSSYDPRNQIQTPNSPANPYSGIPSQNVAADRTYNSYGDPRNPASSVGGEYAPRGVDQSAVRPPNPTTLANPHATASNPATQGSYDPRNVGGGYPRGTANHVTDQSRGGLRQADNGALSGDFSASPNGPTNDRRFQSPEIYRQANSGGMPQQPTSQNQPSSSYGPSNPNAGRQDLVMPNQQGYGPSTQSPGPQFGQGYGVAQNPRYQPSQTDPLRAPPEITPPYGRAPLDASNPYQPAPRDPSQRPDYQSPIYDPTIVQNRQYDEQIQSLDNHRMQPNAPSGNSRVEMGHRANEPSFGGAPGNTNHLDLTRSELQRPGQRNTAPDYGSPPPSQSFGQPYPNGFATDNRPLTQQDLAQPTRPPHGSFDERPESRVEPDNSIAQQDLAPPNSTQDARENSAASNVGNGSHSTQDDPPIPSVALDGFCPMTLVEHRSWEKGSAAYGCIHRGRLYLFTSGANRDRFLEFPDRFAPMLSGYDPVVFAEQDELVEGSREHGVFAGGHIFMFESEASLLRFQENVDYYTEYSLEAMGISADDLDVAEGASDQVDR